MFILISDLVHQQLDFCIARVQLKLVYFGSSPLLPRDTRQGQFWPFLHQSDSQYLEGEIEGEVLGVGVWGSDLQGDWGHSTWGTGST